MRLRWEQLEPVMASRLRAAAIIADGANTETENKTGQATRARDGVLNGPFDAAAIAAEYGMTGMTAARIEQAQGAGRGAGSAEDRFEVAWSAFALFVAVLLVGLYLNVCFAATGPAALLVFTMVPLALLAALCTPEFSPRSRAGARRGPVADLRGLLRDRKLADVAQTRAESLYAEIVTLIAETDSAALPPRRRRFAARRVGDDAPTTTPALDARAARDLLAQTGAVVRTSRRVDAERARVERELAGAGGVSALQAIETEKTGLLTRLYEETDPLARQSLRDALSLCDERVETVRALSPQLARLSAHADALCQSLALTRASLVANLAAPVAAHSPQGEITALRQTVQSLAAQTRAVEELL